VDAFGFLLRPEYFLNHETPVNQTFPQCPEVPRQKVNLRIEARDSTVGHLKPQRFTELIIEEFSKGLCSPIGRSQLCDVKII
jgi:hypothetical protein